MKYASISTHRKIFRYMVCTNEIFPLYGIIRDGVKINIHGLL